MMLRIHFLIFLSCLFARAAELPSTLYEEWRKSPAPADGSVALVNPPSLQWASEKHWKGRDVRYRVELSENTSFPEEKTINGGVQRACFFNPHAKLAPGTWHWRYEIQDGTKREVKGPYTFQIATNTPVFETPAFAKFLAGLPKAHPRVITQGHTLAEVRASAAKHPLAKNVIAQGRKAATAEIYDGPVRDSDPARGRALERKAGREVKFLDSLVDGYVLSGDTGLRDAALKRLDVVLKWPTDDLLGSQVLTTLATTFDALHDELSAGTCSRMLAVMDKQIRHGLSAWPGNIEGRQVENHFWQVELSGNFTAALATIGELESSREMLEYTYELFLARFPNLATPDGGWAEGLGYFGVNKSAVVDMALLLKKVGHVDVFKKEWYQSLPDYFIYCAPINGRMDGFGDMHDRVGNGNIGQAMMLVVGEENNDPKALYRAAALANAKSETEDWGEGVAAEPWYQIVNNIAFDPSRISRPANLPQTRMFRGVGLAAFHTDVLDSSRDTAVYFRSSPFGAKGHMHANQNSFNLSRRGEPLFYSTGYYTTFGDAHSMSSYRHTRAHNSILVNGCGQAFGHEGYGWIKRFISGEQIAYVCGDATMAYRPTVDQQFLDMLKESKIKPTRENGYGDSKLELFERHLLLIRPDTVVIYDVLASDVASDWTMLLHTMTKPELDSRGLLGLATEKNFASGFVTGSQPLNSSVTDQFWSPPVDIKKKYKAMPPQFHIIYESKTKSKGMRFLTILQIATPGEKIAPLVDGGTGQFTIGNIKLHAELDPLKPAYLAASTGSAQLCINVLPDEMFGRKITPPQVASSVLAEKNEGGVSVTISEDEPPEY